MINSFLYFAAQGAGCNFTKPNFLAFPPWYAYLKGVQDAQGVCTPAITGLNDIWLIVAAGIEIMLRIAAIAAVAMVIYGGISYTLSQGDPEKVAKAKNTIINAAVGLVIAIIAAATVGFIAGSIK